MDCILEKIGPSPKGANLDLWRCVRKNCGRESHFLNGIEQAFGAPDCNGLPLNAREIVAMFSEACGLDRAAAIVRYIRWRAKGSPLDELPPGVPSPNIAPPTEGPGTELHKIFAELYISPTVSCQCEAMRNQMNSWGPEGCREHRDEILEHLRKAYDETTILSVIRAGATAVIKRLPKSLEGLLDLAIERSDKS
jgi:hypothetical protein